MVVVAHYRDGELTIIDRIKEMERLGDGIDKDCAEISVTAYHYPQ